MMKRVTYVLLLLLIIFSFGSSADAAPIRVSAAASLTDALKAVVLEYRKDYPEQKFLLNFASSGALARQIAAGAPADIYISANPKWMSHLVQLDLIATETEQELVMNRLVFVGRKNIVAAMDELPKLARIAIGSPKATPVGDYSVKAMEYAGVYSELTDSQRLVLAKDVRQALLYADRGEVDGAFVYQTDARLADKAQVLFVVPQNMYPRVVYPAALTSNATEKPEAKKFFSYLRSGKAGRIFVEYGFSHAEQH